MNNSSVCLDNVVRELHVFFPKCPNIGEGNERNATDGITLLIPATKPDRPRSSRSPCPT